MGTPSIAAAKEAPPGSSSSCHCPGRSAILLKAVMAVTGLILFGFTFVHMVGNLLVFLPPEAINSYGYLLHHSGIHGLTLIWPFRIFLLAAAVAHIVAAIVLTKRNRAARPVAYAEIKPNGATLASRTMFVGGLVLAVFIVFHILHFTTGTIRPAGTFEEGNVYSNVVASFRIWWVVLFYVIAMAFLGLHLYHGAWSSVRTLGATGESPDPFHRRASATLAILVWLGFTLVPLAVFFGLVG